MPKDKHNPKKRKTYRDVVRDLEGKKGTTQERIEKSMQPQQYDEASLVKKTAGRLRRLFTKPTPKTTFAPSRYRKRFERQKRREELAKQPTTVRTKVTEKGLRTAGLTADEIARLRGKKK